MTTTPEQGRAWRARQRDGLARVYRCFDADDRLVYIGSTTLPVKERMRLHRVKHARTGRLPWTERVHRIEVDVFASADEANAVELQSIRRLQPEGNKVGTTRWSIERSRPITVISGAVS